MSAAPAIGPLRHLWQALPRGLRREALFSVTAWLAPRIARPEPAGQGRAGQFDGGGVFRRRKRPWFWNAPSMCAVRRYHFNFRNAISTACSRTCTSSFVAS
jgi:hypothetical protein